MKKFHLFAGGDYYPEGGINDYIGSYETEKEAIIDAANGYYVGDSYDWWHVIETLEDGSIIMSTNHIQERTQN